METQNPKAQLSGKQSRGSESEGLVVDVTNTTNGGSRAKTGIPVSFARFTLFGVLVNVELIVDFEV